MSTKGLSRCRVHLRGNGPGYVTVFGGPLRADVVGPDRDAGVFHSLRDKAAAREEIDKGWNGGVHEFF